MDQLIIIAVVLLLVILAVAFFIFRPRGDVDVKRRLASDDESMPTIAGPSAARKPAASGDADQPAQGAPGGGSGFGGPVKSNATYTTPRFVSKEEAPVNFDDDPPGPLFAPREAGPPSNGDMAFDRRAVRPGDAPIPGGPGGPGGAGGDVTFDRRAVRPGSAEEANDTPESQPDSEPGSGAPPA